MFGFKRKSAVQPPTAALGRAIAASGLPPGVDDHAALRVVERQERYSGRKVTQVRVFDPASAERRGVAVGAYGDLDLHPDLILWTGRVEQDGTVTITRQAAAASTVAPTRQAADRGAHGDVDHLLDQSVGRAEHDRYSRDGADSTV